MKPLAVQTSLSLSIYRPSTTSQITYKVEIVGGIETSLAIYPKIHFQDSDGYQYGGHSNLFILGTEIVDNAYIVALTK